MKIRLANALEVEEGKGRWRGIVATLISSFFTLGILDTLDS